MDVSTEQSKSVSSFFNSPRVEVETIPVANGVPFGLERVSHPEVGIGGAFGTWGHGYDNEALVRFVETRFDEPLNVHDRLALATLGFVSRHHTPFLTPDEHIDLEIAVGVRMLRAATQANGWEPNEVEGVLIGMSAPVTEDYVERISREAGIPDSALKVSVHKACDSSVGALHAALNPDLPLNKRLPINISERLFGKKILVGGIEGLSRFVGASKDRLALQLFGNGAGVIGVIPGQTMRFLVGKTREVFDEKGVLAVAMYYPHSRQQGGGISNEEVSQIGENHLRIAGLMHEPSDGSPVVMAGPMGMVKLFVRTGVEVVRDVYWDYQANMRAIGNSGKQLMVAVVHHANLKINILKAKHLEKEGIKLSMPWVLSEFGNVSAASNMIAFLRQLPGMSLGDHILIDGFGAGTYFDAFAVSLG
jgi:hypothetical protein